MKTRERASDSITNTVVRIGVCNSCSRYPKQILKANGFCEKCNIKFAEVLYNLTPGRGYQKTKNKKESIDE